MACFLLSFLVEENVDDFCFGKERRVVCVGMTKTPLTSYLSGKRLASRIRLLVHPDACIRGGSQLMH